MNPHDKIYVAGHRGLAGSAILRALERRGFRNLVTRTRAELDLRDAAATARFFAAERPGVVFLAAAKVGGIKANISAPADFLEDNLRIQCNTIAEAARHGVGKFVYLGSSCVYPRACPQPMREEHLLTGPLEPTNEGYALAKIAGLRLVRYYHEQHGLDGLCPMPCNLYGPGDHFDLERSHVMSALVKRFVDARESGAPSVTLWGTGVSRREFLHSDDLAEALFVLLEKWPGPDIINVGSGVDHSIRELAEMTARLVGYRGRIEWDASKPDGMPRKCLDVSRLQALGFRPRIGLEDGIGRLIREYEGLRTAETR
jgi:GDP-L-fucose synthase